MSATASAYQLLRDNAEGCRPDSVENLIGYDTFSDVEGPDDVLGASERRRQVERSLLRKLDLRVGFLILVYTINYMDRNNIAAARLKGLEEDLGLTGQQFNTLISVLSVGYVIMQIPSNIVLNQISRPSIYLSTCVLLWGVISVTTGAAQSFHAALVARFLLGFSEAVFYPGVLFLLSRWYKRHELGLRMAYFTAGISLSNIFGSLFASWVLAVMDGKLGYAAWRWLFFIEGGLTCAIATIAISIVPDFPTTPVPWLTPEEQMLAQKRMEEDVGAIGPKLSKSSQASGLTEALADWTVWWLAIAATMLSASESFGTFFPTLVATMGYSPTITLLLCAPPSLLSFATAIIVVRHSDMTRDRFWHIVVSLLLGIIGFVSASLTMNNTIRYISFLLMKVSTVAWSLLLTWTSNTIPESSKRAVAIAFLNVCATIGDIGTAYLWPASWGPTYSKSFLLCALAALVSIAILWAFRLHLVRLNKKAEMEENTRGLPEGFRYIT